MKYIVICTLLLVSGCAAAQKTVSYKTDNLEIEQITKHTFVHLSYLETSQWGKVPSNGLVYINKGQALVFDTPANEAASTALINWIQDKMNAEIKAVVVNHFHEDCIAGLAVFHGKGIPSYASSRTLELLKSESVDKEMIPQNGFEEELTLRIGNKKAINKYFGKAHTKDNIVSYIPSEKVLFGGCMVKETGAGKGNLADADVIEWPNTIMKVKNEFHNAAYVIPGHGKYGDKALLDYTIDLFKNIK